MLQFSPKKENRKICTKWVAKFLVKENQRDKPRKFFRLILR
ncbi:hypothetical protein HMPREF1054_0802 [Haemophilus paraphrohaemolyticus HK411]|uniref:Uncharacterized protein n=1 Tax=Haemophilus paraphrohaemolyticus HK411 TaxID=1095743 RepID=I2NCF4_9PAST|nr:hypothetical protein HMPREF1054_0802 [Haemophilus paraphrohaemolyticus HK411]